MDTDDRLLHDVARDLDAAFPALVDAHADRLYTIALRMLGDAADAEEAAQDALVRAYRALAGYDTARIHDLRLRPWLATIVLNLCRTRGARRARRGPAPASVDTLAATGVEFPAAESAGPSAVVERRAQRDRWAAWLAELPPAYRAPLVLRHVDGLSYPEVAEALGRPEGTVKAQVHRAIRLLRSRLEADAQLVQEMTA